MAPYSDEIADIADQLEQLADRLEVGAFDPDDAEQILLDLQYAPRINNLLTTIESYAERTLEERECPQCGRKG